MSRTKKIIFIVLISLTIGAIWVYRNWQKEEFMPGKENVTLIKLGNGNNPLYLKAKIWGVAGNHEEIVLSRSNSNESNKRDDYIFYTSEVFYEVENDSSVIVYAPESSISEPVSKIQSVIVKGLKTADEIRDYNINYQKYGLQRISVYE